MEIEYSAPGYRQMLGYLRQAGYKFVGFQDFKPEGRKVILRHDIDFSLDCAVRQAQVNHEEGVSATFFFLLTSEQYNLHCKEGRSALAQVLSFGQKLGLHLDCTVHGPDANIDEVAEQECRILQEIAGASLEAVSFHRPAPELVGRQGLLAGLPHAYEPSFFDEVGYCSDSRGRFYHGTPFEHASFRQGLPMQLLTHPIWWMRGHQVEPLEALAEVENERNQAISDGLAANCDPYRAMREAAESLSQ